MSTQTSSIIWLDNPNAQQPSLVGNKAATLARLRELGHDIPDGFCIAVAREPAEATSLCTEIEEALNGLMPPWAVRSSATVEDSPAYAFPGLFRTVLDLADVQSVCEAVAQVQESATTPTVASYAAHHGIAADVFRMGVLIQTLVPATAAGVAFSRDPVTADPGVVIEANYGLGETVVDGSVTPDSVTVLRNGTVTKRQIGSKRAKVVVTTHGTRIRRLSTSDLERSARVLDDDAARRIAGTVYQLEDDLKMPVDVEWALVVDRLYILQARPITTFVSF